MTSAEAIATFDCRDRGRWYMYPVCLLFGMLCIGPAVLSDSSEYVVRALLGLFGLAVIVGLLVLTRSRVTVQGAAVIVRNPIRRVEIAAADVVSVDIVMKSVPFPFVRLTMSDGVNVNVYALNGNYNSLTGRISLSERRLSGLKEAIRQASAPRGG